MEAEQANVNELRQANHTMLLSLQWLASNRNADPIAITSVLASAIAAGESVADVSGQVAMTRA